MIRQECSISEIIHSSLNLFEVDPESNTVVRPMTLLYYGTVQSLADELNVDTSDYSWRDNLLEAMKYNKKWSMEKSEPLCKNNVPREGVVVRIEGSKFPKAMKLKCSKFEISESAAIDSGEHLYES